MQEDTEPANLHQSKIAKELGDRAVCWQQASDQMKFTTTRCSYKNDNNNNNKCLDQQPEHYHISYDR